VPRLKLENDDLFDKLGRIMQAMSGASHELTTLRRQARRLEAENSSLRAELDLLRDTLRPLPHPARRLAAQPAAGAQRLGAERAPGASTEGAGSPL
jgi:regulator of replication initiation timing